MWWTRPTTASDRVLGCRPLAGRSLDVTDNHPFLCYSEDGPVWVEAGDLRPCRSARSHDGDWVVIGMNYNGVGRTVVLLMRLTCWVP